MTTTTADWARYYGHLGWRVFPVKVGAKSPIYRNWQADATTDPKLIGQYWSDGEASDRNVGVVCGEAFDAWDIEAAHLSAFSAWMYDHGVTLPADCPIASTGRGGVHILTSPTGVDGTRNLYLGTTHIGELKSRGGFIVVCPSETEATYLWINVPRLPLAEATPWLLELLERPTALRKSLPTRLASPDDMVNVLGRLAGSVAYSTAESHHRNSYLYWATRQAIEEGIPVHHVVKAMTAAAIQAGLDRDDQGMAGIEKTIDSAIGAESIAA